MFNQHINIIKIIHIVIKSDSVYLKYTKQTHHQRGNVERRCTTLATQNQGALKMQFTRTYV